MLQLWLRNNRTAFGIHGNHCQGGTPAGLLMTTCSVNKSPRIRTQTGHHYSACFYSLSFLSQWVDSTTCTKCMSPDHHDRDCALDSLEDHTPSQFPPPSNQHAEGSNQAIPRRRKREGTLGPSSSPSARVCYSWNEGQCFCFPMNVTASTSISVNIPFSLLQRTTEVRRTLTLAIALALVIK